MKKGTAIAIGIFAALLIAFFASRERQVSVGVRKLELPVVETDKVTAIEITGPKPASLKKEGAAWMVVDPKKPDQKHPADETQVNSMLDAYKEIKVGATAPHRSRSSWESPPRTEASICARATTSPCLPPRVASSTWPGRTPVPGGSAPFCP